MRSLAAAEGLPAIAETMRDHLKRRLRLANVAFGPALIGCS
jgi:hypothetical protein